MWQSYLQRPFYGNISAPIDKKLKKICNKTVDDCLAPIKFIPDWLVCYN